MTDFQNTLEKPKSIEPSLKDVQVGSAALVKNHVHNGIDAERIKPEQLKNAFFPVVTDVPTEAPTRFIDQIKIYIGAEPLLYVWDNTNGAWRKFNYYEEPAP